jgi:hypothetical protein
VSYTADADDLPAPAIGHNSAGHLDAEYAPLLRRFADMAAMGEAFLADHAKIENDEQAGILAGVVKQIKVHRAAVEAARKEAKQPSLDEGRHVDGFFKDGMLDPLDDLASRLLDLATPYVRERGKVRGDFASLGLQLNVSYEVVDLALVPPEFLTVNDKAVKSAIAGKNGRRDIPGLRVIVSQEAVNR